MRIGIIAAAVALALSAQGAAARETLSGAYLAARHANATNDVAAAARYFHAALRRDRDNPRLMELAALNLLAAGRVTDAVPVAARLAEREPANRVATLALAVDAVARGDFAGARARMAARADGFYPLIGRLIEAWAAFGLGDATGAEAALAALEDRPVFTLFEGYHLGLMRAIAGDHAGAIAAYESAVAAVGSPSPRLAAALGASLEAEGRVDEARALYAERGSASFADPLLAERLRRLDAGEPPAPLVRVPAEGVAEALHGFAGVFANEAGRRLALAYARLALHLRPDLDEAMMLVAELLEADEQHAAALEAYALVPPESPYASRARIGGAGALAALDREDEAADALRALVADAPADARAHVALGDLMRRKQRWEEGAAAYGAAIDLLAAEGVENWALFYQRGICFERGGEWDRAEADFRKALALQPDQPLVLNYLGYSLVEQRRDLEEAKAMIERAVELRPEDGYITDSLGWVLYRMGDFEGAVEWLERAVALAPTDPVINDHLGDALWMVGRRLEAAFQWRRARSFQPEPADLARIKRKLAVGLDVVLREEEAAATVAVPAAAQPTVAAPKPSAAPAATDG